MQLLRELPGAHRSRRDVVTVEGVDAGRFLQGQLSQDIDALSVGDSARSLLLEPQGRVVAWLRVHRTAVERYLLDVEEGFGAAVDTRLRRFLLRTRADLSVATWDCVELRGTGVDAVAVEGTGAVLASPVVWAGVPGVDLLGPSVDTPTGVPEVDDEAIAALRIEAGVPAMGHEFLEETIPAEAGVVPESVSFTKGCYTGQELVARVDSRGNNTPRRLRALVLEGDMAPAVGAEVVFGGDVVGRVTSAARSPLLGAAVALAYLHRKVEVPAEVVVVCTAGECLAQAVEPPLVVC